MLPGAIRAIRGYNQPVMWESLKRRLTEVLRPVGDVLDDLLERSGRRPAPVPVRRDEEITVRPRR